MRQLPRAHTRARGNVDLVIDAPLVEQPLGDRGIERQQLNRTQRTDPAEPHDPGHAEELERLTGDDADVRADREVVGAGRLRVNGDLARTDRPVAGHDLEGVERAA
jgi:hypothetical protein